MLIYFTCSSANGWQQCEQVTAAPIWVKKAFFLLRLFSRQSFAA
jgi:hypothetical protein